MRRHLASLLGTVAAAFLLVPAAGAAKPATKPQPETNPVGTTAAEGGAFFESVNVDVINVEVFVTDKPDFSADRGTSSHELVWQSKGQYAQVFLPSGLSEGQVDQQKDPKERTVRLVLNRDVASVDMNGKRLWSGPHQLADAPRYVGVRLIRTAGERTDPVIVTSLRVLKP